jgi:chromosomal replication initiator protein
MGGSALCLGIPPKELEEIELWDVHREGVFLARSACLLLRRGGVMSNPGASTGIEIQESVFSKRKNLIHRDCHVEEPTGMAHGYLSQLPCESNVKSGSHSTSEKSILDQMSLPGIRSYHPSPLANGRFTFDQFVVGPSNQFAYRAAWAVANEKRGAYNPLYFYGESGLGKSHLSGAIGNHIYKTQPNARVLYVSAEEFVSEMVAAIRKQEMWEFKEKFRRRCDVLCIDGVHFLSGKDKTQAELSHTLDHLYHSGKQIILTASFPPHELRHMTDGLKSRLGCGLVVDIKPPDIETRKMILRRRAEFEGSILPDEVVDLLASKVWGNIRRLEGMLINLIAKASFLSRRIELELAQEVVGLFQMAEKRRTTINSIQELVAGQYQIEVEQLVSRSRRKSICHPRQVAMYLCRKFTDESLDTIGMAFCRDHASVIHSIGVVERQKREKAKVRREIDFLVERLRHQDGMIP